MTQDDMETIVDYYLGGINTKAVLEDTDVQVNRVEVESFLDKMASYVDDAIGLGAFDE
jgi:hypothetical protein